MTIPHAPSLPAWLDVPPEQRLDLLADKLHDLCPMRMSVQRVLQASQRKDGSIEEVVEALLTDPILTAEVLKVANSPLYRAPAPVSDVRQAVVMMGMQELHDIAAALAMLAAFESDQPLASDLRSSSVLSGTLASLLTREMQTGSRSHAFLAALLSQVGAMALLSLTPDLFVYAWESSDGSWDMLPDFETELYGTTSVHIGAAYLARASLPSEVVQTIQLSAQHPTPWMEDGARVTRFARLASSRMVKAAAQPEAVQLEVELPAFAQRMGIEVPPERLLEIALQAAAHAELGLRGDIGLSPVAGVQRGAPSAQRTSTGSTPQAVSAPRKPPESKPKGWWPWAR